MLFVRGREALVEPSAPLIWNQPQILGSPVPFCTGSSLCSPGLRDLQRCLQRQQAGVPQTRNSRNEKSSLIPIRSVCALSSPGSNSASNQDPAFPSGQVSVRTGRTQALGGQT